MPFVKLDCGILDSTIWVEASDTRVCWITMLAMANADGLVEATAPGISRKASISLEATRTALAILESPDGDSRSLTANGRRIERVDGGYQILNYQKYREKDYTAAVRAKKYRDRKTSRRDDCDETVTVTQAEAEVYTEVEVKKQTVTALPDWMPVESWNDFLEMRKKIRKSPTAHAKDLLVKKIDKFFTAGMDVKAILEQSTVNCWQDVFPLREERHKGNGKAKGSFARLFGTDETAGS